VVNKEFIEKVKDSTIEDKVKGSDHCPIEIFLKL